MQVDMSAPLVPWANVCVCVVVAMRAWHILPDFVAVFWVTLHCIRRDRAAPTGAKPTTMRGAPLGPADAEAV